MKKWILILNYGFFFFSPTIRAQDFEEIYQINRLYDTCYTIQYKNIWGFYQYHNFNLPNKIIDFVEKEVRKYNSDGFVYEIEISKARIADLRSIPDELRDTAELSDDLIRGRSKWFQQFSPEKRTFVSYNTDDHLRKIITQYNYNNQWYPDYEIEFNYSPLDEKLFSVYEISVSYLRDTVSYYSYSYNNDGTTKEVDCLRKSYVEIDSQGLTEKSRYLYTYEGGVLNTIDYEEYSVGYITKTKKKVSFWDALNYWSTHKTYSDQISDPMPNSMIKESTTTYKRKKKGEWLKLRSTKYTYDQNRKRISENKGGVNTDFKCDNKGRVIQEIVKSTWYDYTNVKSPDSVDIILQKKIYCYKN